MLGLLVRDEWQWPFLDINSSYIIPARDKDGFRTITVQCVDLEIEKKHLQISKLLATRKKKQMLFLCLRQF